MLILYFIIGWILIGMLSDLLLSYIDTEPGDSIEFTLKDIFISAAFGPILLILGGLVMLQEKVDWEKPIIKWKRK